MIRIQSIAMALVTICFSIYFCQAQTRQGVKQKDVPTITFARHESENRVDVLIDGKLFTSYTWPGTVFKPVLYPILTSSGTPITRGFPITPRPGERTDHPHHAGSWLNYGNVNGYDFWNNGLKGKRDTGGGQIKHISIEQLEAGKGEGSMVVKASWVDPAGKELLSERTVFHFIAKGPVRIIDRVTTLTAGNEKVVFKDTKEGVLGIRVTRELELPSKENVTLTDAQGNATLVKTMSNEGVTGNYKSSEGVTGEAVWGTRAKWMNLYGNVGNEKISLVICDHPKNLNYPVYWHARGYGLFAANPFGVHDFTKGKKTLDYSIAPGNSLTLRYRIIVGSTAHLTDAEINGFADDFGKRY